MEHAAKLLIIEPFYGGSHRKLLDVVCTNLPKHLYHLITMTAKKWHWRARTSALYISSQIPYSHKFEILFCTSVLPLTELLGLRSDLVCLRKIVYFHENQLQYPVRVTKERDFQYGFNEIMTCLAADKILFNSQYNQESFLHHIHSHLKLQPDYRLQNVKGRIKPKCQVVYYPLQLEMIDKYINLVQKEDRNVLHIVWPHRWEFDKNPEAFYDVLCKLDEEGVDFQVSILGESFDKKPELFTKITSKLSRKLAHCGYIDKHEEYYGVLKRADVVVSTAIHEFFGVAVLEAVYCGCIPVVPNRLSYKELFVGKVEEIYDNDQQLLDILKDLSAKKMEGQISKDYSHLALPFESSKWFESFSDILQVY